jgi:hypothetical protein
VLAGIVSGYLSIVWLLLFPIRSETITLPLPLLSAILLLPGYCIFTFPAAMLLAGIFYVFRRVAFAFQTPLVERAMLVAFAVTGAACGFGVGKLWEMWTLAHVQDFIGVGTVVGAVIGFADYFVWRHCFELNRVA